MTAVTSAMVKALRERTGLGIMDCKKALVESSGDINLAIDQLRKASKLKAAAKAGRIAAEGLVTVKTSLDAKLAVLVEVNVETDFAARHQSFIDFVSQIGERALALESEDVQALLEGGFEAKREALVQEIGENISIRRIALARTPNGSIGSYVHTNNRIATLIALEGGTTELAREVAVHATAANPQVVSPSDIPEALVTKEREIYTAQARNSGKPDHIIEKMVEGRVRKFLNENSLLEQPFLKDQDKKIGQLLKEGNAKILAYHRFEVGDGIEVEKQDFASEVAAARA